MTPRAMRKAPKAVSAKAFNRIGAATLKATPSATIASNERKISDLEAALRKSIAAKEAQRLLDAAKVARQAVVTPPPPIIAPRPAQAARTAVLTPLPTLKPRPATLTPITSVDWHAAARFTMRLMRKPALLVDSTCREVDEVTQVATVAQGDWAGLGRAVEAGVMTHAEAVELAASWSVQVANG